VTDTRCLYSNLHRNFPISVSNRVTDTEHEFSTTGSLFHAETNEPTAQ